MGECVGVADIDVGGEVNATTLVVKSSQAAIAINVACSCHARG
jgi:hypothetical protein